MSEETSLDLDRWERCRKLARRLLNVGEKDEDLTRKYLEVLIDRGLEPPTREPRSVLIVGAGIAGLVAGMLLKQAGHRVRIVEANGSRVGGRIKTFRDWTDETQYAEAGAMRLPEFHPLVLALVDKLELKRRLFFNVDVDPETGNQDARVPPVVYEPFDGTPTWRNGDDSPDFQPPEKRSNTWIRTNGLQVRRREYAGAPAPVNRGFHVPDADLGTTTGKLVNDAVDAVRDYYSDEKDGRRVNKEFDEWVDGWARVIYDFDAYSMWRFLKEHAGFSDETLEATGTIENLTSRLMLGFFHSFLGRSDINPNVTYWELEGGTDVLPEAVRRKFFSDDEIVMDARVTHLEYLAEDRDCSACSHVAADGPRVWVRTVGETEGGEENGAVETREFTADAAIVTLPFSSLRHVTVTPPFSYKKRRAIIEVHYDSATKVLLEFSRRWWEFTEEDWARELGPELYAEYRDRDEARRRMEKTPAARLGAHESVDDDGTDALEEAYYEHHRQGTEVHQRPASHVFGGGSVTDNPNRFCYYPSHPAPGSRGGIVLASYTWSDDASRWDSMPDEERYPYALRGLQAIHGDRIEVFYTGRGRTQSWMRNPYAFGEAVVLTPGQLTQFHLDIPTPEGPVHFAGDHTSLKHAWIEGSLESAVRAALEIHESTPGGR
jgi:monoamine oxidase